MKTTCYCCITVKKNAFLTAVRLHRMKMCVIDTVLDYSNAVFAWVNEENIEKLLSEKKYIVSVEVDKTKVVLQLPDDDTALAT